MNIFTILRSRIINLGGKNVGLLVIGTVLTNAVNLLVIPILTRLYTPEQFSILTVFAGVSGILGVVACLRYDLGIAVEKDESIAAHLFVLCSLIASAFTISLSIILLWIENYSPRVMSDTADIFDYAWLIPIAVAATSWMTIVHTWTLRAKDFAQISRSRVIQAVIGASVQVLGGVTALGILPLLLGQAAKSSTGLVVLLRTALANLCTHELTLEGLYKAGKKYWRLPTYSVLEALSNAAAMQGPILLIAFAYPGPEAGHLGLGLIVMQAPMALIGSAVGQGFLSYAGDNARTGRLGEAVRLT